MITYSVCLTSLNTISPKAICVAADGEVSFFMLSHRSLYACTTSLSIGHLSCFHIFSIVNDAAVSIGVHISFQINVFVLFKYIPSCGISGSYVKSIFSSLRQLHAVFHSGCPSLHSYPTVHGVPFSPHPGHLLCSL